MNTRIVGAQASIAPTIIACTVVMIAPYVRSTPWLGQLLSATDGSGHL
jgi:hypothetical protein